MPLPEGMTAWLIRRDPAARLLPVTRPIDHELDRPNLKRSRHSELEPLPGHVDNGGVNTINGTNNAEVKKLASHRRLLVYGFRLSKWIGKVPYMGRTGQLPPSSEVWQPGVKGVRHG